MKISVLGAGSWGTALALRLAKNNNEVFLWGHREEHIRSLGKDRENKKYLPEIKFPENLVPIIDLEMAVKYSAWEYGKTAQDSTFLSCTYKKPFVMPRAENYN